MNERMIRLEGRVSALETSAESLRMCEQTEAIRGLHDLILTLSERVHMLEIEGVKMANGELLTKDDEANARGFMTGTSDDAGPVNRLPCEVATVDFRAKQVKVWPLASLNDSLWFSAEDSCFERNDDLLRIDTDQATSG